MIRKVGIVLRVLGSFLVVELGLRRSSLGELCARIGVGLESGLTGVAADEEVTVPGATVPRWRVEQIMRIVVRVSRRWPFGDTCLRRCLVTGRMLVATGVPVTVVIGVRRSDAVVQAHSWLEIDGVSLDPSSVEWERLART